MCDIWMWQSPILIYKSIKKLYMYIFHYVLTQTWANNRTLHIMFTSSSIDQKTQSLCILNNMDTIYHHDTEMDLSIESNGKEHKSCRIFKCNDCSFQTEFKFNLKRHMGKHLCMPEHKCTECTKSFKEKCELDHHLKGHMGELICTFCAKTFMSRQGLQ